MSHQAAFGPMPAWVIEMSTKLVMWPRVAPMLDEAWHGAPIEDWQAVRDEVRRGARERNTADRPRLQIKRSTFDQHVIDDGPRVLNWK